MFFPESPQTVADAIQEVKRNFPEVSFSEIMEELYKAIGCKVLGSDEEVVKQIMGLCDTVWGKAAVKVHFFEENRPTWVRNGEHFMTKYGEVVTVKYFDPKTEMFVFEEPEIRPKDGSRLTYKISKEAYLEHREYQKQLFEREAKSADEKGS